MSMRGMGYKPPKTTGGKSKIPPMKVPKMGTGDFSKAPKVTAPKPPKPPKIGE